jgi:hypothetical protein
VSSIDLLLLREAAAESLHRARKLPSLDEAFSAPRELFAECAIVGPRDTDPAYAQYAPPTRPSCTKGVREAFRTLKGNGLRTSTWSVSCLYSLSETFLTVLCTQ